MPSTPECRELLNRILGTATLAEAVALVPEDWHMFVAGVAGVDGQDTCEASIAPCDLVPGHTIERLYRRGYGFGRGASRHAALLEACRFVLARLPDGSFRALAA